MALAKWIWRLTSRVWHIARPQVPLYVIVIVVAVMVVAGGGDGCDRLLPLLVWLVVLFVVCLAGCGCHPW